MNPHARAAADPPDEPPRGVRHIVRIVRCAEDFVVALQVAGIDRQVRLAEDNGTCFAQAGNWPGFFWDELSQLRGTRGRLHAGGLEGIFNRHGHAMQRPTHLATRQGGVGRVGFSPRPFGIDCHYAVDGLIKRRDPRQEIIDGFSARNLALADLLRDRNCTAIGELRNDNVLRIPLLVSAKPSNIGRPTIDSTLR